MADKSRKREGKEKNGYTFLMVSNKSGKVHEIKFTGDFLLVLLIVIVLAVVGGLFYLLHYSGELNDERLQIIAWQAQYNEAANSLTIAESENEELKTEKEKLEKKLTDLENQLSRKDYLEQQSSSAEATKYVPSGLPISGQVSVPSKYSKSLEGVTFTVGAGAKIVASGNGSISSVKYDNTYGYIVAIDHGNDFISYYCYDTQPLVSEGENVSRGQSIFLTSDNSGFTYKISYQGNYIDPNTVLEVDG